MVEDREKKKNNISFLRDNHCSYEIESIPFKYKNLYPLLLSLFFDLLCFI